MNSAYLEFLYNLGLFNIKLGLSTISEMLKRMGDPHHHPRIIHFAGTNGKGSTLVTLERLLLDSGFSTGSTISPHLQSFNERFRINGQQVTDQLLDKAFESVCHACDIDLDLTTPESRDGVIRPTFFEFAIAIAFELFRISKVDYILLETGLGGRLDATNVVENPIACVITRIAIDHQEYLGETLAEITLEKLGILKQGSPVFVALQQHAVLKQIQEFCSKSAIVPYYHPEHFDYRSINDTCTDYSISLPGLKTRVVNVATQSLLGKHQKHNTVSALAVYFSVIPKEKQLSDAQIGAALQNVHWKGRLEYLDETQTILLDGAHNESAIGSLFDYLRINHASQKILFAIGWKADKHIAEVIDIKGLKQAEFLPIQMQSKSALNANTALQLLNKKYFRTYQPVSVKQLATGILHNSLPVHDLLVITGSLYLLGEFFEKWQQIKPIINHIKHETAK